MKRSDRVYICDKLGGYHPFTIADMEKDRENNKISVSLIHIGEKDFEISDHAICLITNISLNLSFNQNTVLRYKILEITYIDKEYNYYRIVFDFGEEIDYRVVKRESFINSILNN